MACTGHRHGVIDGAVRRETVGVGFREQVQVIMVLGWDDGGEEGLGDGSGGEEIGGQGGQLGVFWGCASVELSGGRGEDAGRGP